MYKIVVFARKRFTVLQGLCAKNFEVNLEVID